MLAVAKPTQKRDHETIGVSEQNKRSSLHDVEQPIKQRSDFTATKRCLKKQKHQRFAPNISSVRRGGSTMRIFLPLALVAAILGGLGTQASSVETPARLLEHSDGTSSNNDAATPSNSTAPAPASHASTSSTPKPAASNASAPASSNTTSSSQNSPKTASSPAPAPSASGSSGGGSTQSTQSSGGGKHSGGSKRNYGSFPAPVAAPTTEPKKNAGGSYMAPVASPSSANEPVPVTHAAVAMDDDAVNATSTGASSTPGNSEPLAHHVYNTPAKNSTIVLPEGEQPKHWPEFLFILFVLATIVLCGLAVRKACSKRRNYEEVPTTLIV